MRLVILAKRRHALGRLLCDQFVERGADAVLLDPKSCASDHLASYDALLIKSSLQLFLRIGFFARGLGCAVYPDPWMAWQVRDRIMNTAVLRVAGLRTPEIVYGPRETVKKRVPDDFFPAVIKPVMSSSNDGIVRVESKRDLASYSGEHLYLQRAVEGTHYRVNFVEDLIYMWRYPPFCPEKTEYVRVAPLKGTADVVRRFRDQTGYIVGDLDLVITDDHEFVIVDPGTFPSFQLVPGIEARLAPILLAYFSNARKVQRRAPIA